MRKRKKKFWQPIVTGFAALYLVSMLLATYYMEAKYAEEFKENAVLQIASIRRQAEAELKEYDGALEPYYACLASQFASADVSGPFQQFSAAFYQTDGTFLAKTEERIGNYFYTEKEGGVYRYYTLEHLSDEEKERLAAYGQQSYERLHVFQEPPKYRISIGTSKDGKTLRRIVVQEVAWEANGTKKTDEYIDPVTDTHYFYENEQGTEYRETGSKIVWERNYPDADGEPLKTNQMEMQDASLLFPYLAWGGYSQWQRWRKSAYLQDFALRLTFSEEDVERMSLEYSQDSYEIQTKDHLYACIWADTDGKFQPVSYLELRFENHPWLAAMNYLKYAYLMILALMLVCIAKSLYVGNKVYQRQAALEEMRRDFTNAMAHELKTPLGIIRGFAENLQEGHMEEKREYYLMQIIGQTEEMNRLVKEMIEVSKMDSEAFTLQKEPVSMRGLIQEQMRRLEPMIQEKHIQVEYACGEDFTVTGDPDYLAKAVWNLLSNAVLYNLENGQLRVQTSANACAIENTADPLTDEQLARAFEMFYSGEDRHMGRGLFLAKKIFDLHGLRLSLANTQTGVSVSIDKHRKRDKIKNTRVAMLFMLV